MAPLAFLASTLLMGVLLLAIVVGLMRARDWQRSPAGASGGGTIQSVAETDPLSGMMDRESLWVAAFLVLVLVFSGSAVLFVSDIPLPGLGEVDIVPALAGAFGLMLTGYLSYGIYVSARSRGRSSAMAAMISAWIIGLLFLVGLTVKLLLAS